MRYLTIIFLLISGSIAAQTNISPYNYCQDGQPIGGGAGMNTYYTSVGADDHITTNITGSALKIIIEAASIGDRIFIDGGVVIDFTDLNSSILVKQGVQITSDRGNAGSEGALLYTDDVRYLGSGFGNPSFVTTGTDVTFSGLRLKGPFGEIGNYSSDDADRRTKWGISSSYNNLTVENCEMYNWAKGAITLSRYGATESYYGGNFPSAGHLVTHNYIHHTRQNSFGYGVDVQHAEVRITANIFAYNRHDITGDTDGTYTKYYADCNTVLGPNISVNFEVHGGEYVSGGNSVDIHYNDFKDPRINRPVNTWENIRINGIPTNGARLTNNRFIEGVTVFTDPYDETGVGMAMQQRGVDPVDKFIGVEYSNNTLNGDDPEPGGVVDLTGGILSESGTNVVYVDENTVNPTYTMLPVTTETGETYTYTKDGTSPDDALFSISTDQLTLGITPDYENPGDANTNNQYFVWVDILSTSTATFTQNFVVVVEDVDETSPFVTDIAWDDNTQTILVGQTVDKSFTFTPASPTNTGVSYYSDVIDEGILDDTGLGMYKGTAGYYIVADDQTNGLIQDLMTVTINPDAWKWSKLHTGKVKTSGSGGKIFVGK